MCTLHIGGMHFEASVFSVQSAIEHTNDKIALHRSSDTAFEKNYLVMVMLGTKILVTFKINVNFIKSF